MLRRWRSEALKFNSRKRSKNNIVEFVAQYSAASSFSLGTPVFSSPKKPTFHFN